MTHCVFGVFGDDLRAADIFAVFRVVRDRIIHVGDTAFIDQINDQLEFVQALKVRHFWRVTRFNERFVTGFDQLNGAATQNRLFAEQIGLSLFAEIGFDDPSFAAAIGRRIRQRQSARLLRRILMHGDQVRHAATLRVGVAHGVAWGLRSNHPDVKVSAWDHAAVVNVETMRERERRARLDVRLDVVGVNRTDLLVRQQHHDHVGGFDGFSHFGNLQARLLGLVPARSTFARANGDFAAAIVQVLRMGMTL